MNNSLYLVQHEIDFQKILDSQCEDILRIIQSYLPIVEMQLEMLKTKYQYVPYRLISSFSHKMRYQKIDDVRYWIPYNGSMEYELLINCMNVFTIDEIHVHFPATGVYNHIKSFAMNNYIMSQITSTDYSNAYMQPNWYINLRKLVICAKIKNESIKLKNL